VIVGLGVDVVDVARFRARAVRAPRLLERLFTAAELADVAADAAATLAGRQPGAAKTGRAAAPSADESVRWRSLAARFAAKEALAKALGAPGNLAWHDAEVRRTEAGAPRLVLAGTVAARASSLGATHWHVSLTHDAGIAAAVVVAEG
jgi:holo-[acyl-carrier protein] synthase